MPYTLNAVELGGDACGLHCACKVKVHVCQHACMVKVRGHLAPVPVHQDGSCCQLTVAMWRLAVGLPYMGLCKWHVSCCPHASKHAELVPLTYMTHV